MRGAADHFADARVEQRRLGARVGANEQESIALLDAGNGAIERIARAQIGGERRGGHGGGRAELVEEILEGDERLHLDDRARVDAHLRAADLGELLSGDSHGLLPADRSQGAVRTAQQRHVEALPLEAVDGIAVGEGSWQASSRLRQGTTGDAFGTRRKRLCTARVGARGRIGSKWHRVLSEIHSSLMSSLVRGWIRITSPPRLSTCKGEAANAVREEMVPKFTAAAPRGRSPSEGKTRPPEAAARLHGGTSSP